MLVKVKQVGGLTAALSNFVTTIEGLQTDIAVIKANPGGRYALTFDTTSWGTVVGGYGISVAASTHGRGINATVQLFELISGVYYVVSADIVAIDSTGNVVIKVPASPDLRFAGKLVIV